MTLACNRVRGTTALAHIYRKHCYSKQQKTRNTGHSGGRTFTEYTATQSNKKPATQSITGGSQRAHGNSVRLTRLGILQRTSTVVKQDTDVGALVVHLDLMGCDNSSNRSSSIIRLGGGSGGGADSNCTGWVYVELFVGQAMPCQAPCPSM